jgi:hypothetical protein
MTTVLLYKGIRDDQSEERQLMAGCFHTDRRENASNYGSIVGVNVIEFLRLKEATQPFDLAREWHISATLIDSVSVIRGALISMLGSDKSCCWPAYHACSYLLDVPLAHEARQRGYDGIHYGGWGIYVKL